MFNKQIYMYIDENWLEIYQFSQELLRNYTAEHMYHFYADFH